MPVRLPALTEAIYGSVVKDGSAWSASDARYQATVRARPSSKPVVARNPNCSQALSVFSARRGLSIGFGGIPFNVTSEAGVPGDGG